jgi:hypothetical protein
MARSIREVVLFVEGRARVPKTGEVIIFGITTETSTESHISLV